MSEPPQADHAASVKKLSRVSRHRRRFDPMIRSFFPALFCLLSSAHAIEVEVSPMGPIRTLTEARDAVRKARTEDPSQGATITIRADVLTLTSPLLLEAQDSNLLLHGQSDKESVLQGAPLVTGWGPHEGKIVKANLHALLPKGFRPRQLFCDGDRQILARYPNHNPKDPLYGGWAFVAPFPGTGAPPEGHDWNRELYVHPKDIRSWAHPEDVEIDIFAQYGWWNFIEPIASLDPKTSKLTLKKPCGYDLHPHNRYHFQNALEELDSEGEWYYDHRTGDLYFWPPSPIEEVEVRVPVLSHILQIKGASGITVRDLTFKACEGTAVVVENSNNCLIEHCRIRQCGGFSGSGISLSAGSACRVSRCEIERTGSTGVGLSGGDRKTLTGPAHIVENCHIHDVGVFNKNACGVALNGVNLIARHNHIHHSPRMGVQMSGNNCKVEWNHIHHVVLETQDGGAIYTGGRDWISSRGTSWSYNLIHDVVGCGQEEGGLKHPWFTFGLYPDDNTGGLDIIGNIVFRCATSAIHLHNARDCVVEDNIFLSDGKYVVDLHGWNKESQPFQRHLATMIKGYESVINEPAWEGMRNMDLHPKDAFRSDGTMMSGNLVKRNIIAALEAGVTHIDLRNCNSKWNTIDENIAWNYGGPVRTNINRVGKNIGNDLLSGSGSFSNDEPGKTPKGWGWNHRPGTATLLLADDHTLVAECAVSDDPKNPHSTFHGPNFAVKPGAAYRATVRIKSSASDRKVGLAIAAYEAGKGYWQDKGSSIAVSPEWQTVEITGSLPRKGDKDYRDWIKNCWVRFDSDSPTGTVSVDDLVIYEAEPLDEWSAWQEEGWDLHSLVGDPLFEKRESDNLKLQVGSPAFQLGFKETPREKIGIQPE